MNGLHPIPDDRAAWHEIRARHVGASEVAALFSAQPDYAMGVYALWQVKAGRVPPPEVTAERVAWGLRLEDAIATAAAESEGWSISPGVYASRDGLGATLDRIIEAPGPNDAGMSGRGALELKNVDGIQFLRWGEEPPLHILLQLQAQLAATGFSWGAVAALVGGNSLRVWRYTARPKLQAEILARVGAFWRSIREDRPPQPDGSDATYRALVMLNPATAEEPADLSEDNEAPELAATFLRLSAEIKERERARDEARNRLLAKLGPHRSALITGFRLSQAVTEAKPDRPAEPGEIIKGRAESRRLIVKEMA